jgi:DNA-binding beta-propeller fold protein YncE
MRLGNLVVLIGVLACGQAGADPTVVLLSTWARPGTGPGQFTGIWDVACAPDGTLLVSDLTRVQRLSAEGAFLEQWLLPPTGLNAHGQPALIAIDALGGAYFPAGFGYVHKVTLSGAPLTNWRTQQTTPGISPDSYGIAVGSDGNVFVSDPHNRNIQKFTPSGQFLLRWGTQGAGQGQFLTVHGIAADQTGHVFAIDNGGAAVNHRVEVFDLAGHFLFQWGSQGSGPGQFEEMDDIAVDASGNVYVTEGPAHRVQEFGPDGSFIGILGGVAGGQLNFPLGIAADGQGNVFVADYLNSAVVKYGPASTATTPSSWGRIKANYR